MLGECPYCDITEVHLLRRYAAFLKRLAFLMPIHPVFCQFLRYVIRPLMAYLESVFIIRGQKVGMVVVALIMAATSPT
jgi:hypothetical protein